VGIPARILRCGPRSVGCSIFANTVNDAAVFGTAELLHHRGKFGKTMAWGLVAWQLANNAQAVWHNKHQVLDERRYVPSGSTGVVWYNQ